MNKLLFLGALFSSALFAYTLDYHLESNSKYGYHLYSRQNLSTHRHTVDIDTTVKEGRFWTGKLGLRAFAEGAESPRAQDPEEILLKDALIQYKSGPWLIRAGNQQVVWGEAFGFYYADLVNPKDFRDFGLGPLDRNRLASPLLNVKYIYKEYSAQFIFIPKAFFNKVCYRGGDFQYPFDRFFPGFQTTVVEERSLPIDSKNFEGGIRLSGNFGNIDTSLLFLYYFDRSPYYESTYTSPTTVEALQKHGRVYTLGFTTSAPLGPLVVRTEVLFHKDKLFTAVTPTGLGGVKSNEAVGVLGVDYTYSDLTQLGVQVSKNYRFDLLSGVVNRQNQDLISIHGSLGTVWEQVFDTILSYIPQDGSFLVQSYYLIPLAKNIEWFVGADLLLGSSTSQFGLYKNSSRAYTSLKFMLDS